MKKTVPITLLGLLCLVLGPDPLAAQQSGPRPFDEKAVAEFYRGKTVRIVVGFAAGGGFDAYSRLIGRHLGKHVPGNPTVIVENMPGAGSMVAANHLYNVGAKDGTLIANIGGPLVLEQLFNNPGVQFDLAKFRHLAVPVAETYLLIVTRKPGITRLEEIFGPNAKSIVFGGIPGSTVEHAGLIFRDVLGANVRVVTGYKGTSEVRLAIDSGEVTGFFNSWTSAKITSLDKFKSGEWLILAQLGDSPIPDLPVSGVPTIPDIAKNEEQRLLLRFGTSVANLFGKIYVMAPGVPADRAAAMEAAFRKAFADKELQGEAERGRLELGPLFGAEIQKLVQEFLGMPPDVRSKLQKVVKAPR